MTLRFDSGIFKSVLDLRVSMTSCGMLLCVFGGGGGSPAQGHSFPVLGIYNNFLNFPDHLVHLLKNPAGSESPEREPGNVAFQERCPRGVLGPGRCGKCSLNPSVLALSSWVQQPCCTQRCTIQRNNWERVSAALAVAVV